jgi:hypothetical protein
MAELRHCAERSDGAIQPFDGLTALSEVERLDRRGVLRSPRDDKGMYGGYSST